LLQGHCSRTTKPSHDLKQIQGHRQGTEICPPKLARVTADGGAAVPILL
jgi:hypothetical protein